MTKEPMTEDQLRERLIGRRATGKDGALYIDGREVTTYADDGDCCGYARAVVSPFADGIVTAVTQWTDRANYGDEDECSRSLVTIFHENTRLADMKAYASSGTGWSYGAVSQVLLDGDVLVEAVW